MKREGIIPKPNNVGDLDPPSTKRKSNWGFSPEFSDDEEPLFFRRNLVLFKRNGYTPFIVSGSSVLIGQMKVASGRVDLYRRLVDKFGELVASSNLPKYQVEPTCVALNGLLDAVAGMMQDMTPKTICQEKVSEWKKMVSFYNGMELKVGWLEDRVCLYNDWLVRRSSLHQLEARVVTKRNVLEAKGKDIRTLESELQVLSADLKKERGIQSEFNFSFFD